MLDTHELSRRPGSMREVSRTVQAPSDLGTVVIGIPEGSEIMLDLRIESVMEGVLVSGTVSGVAVGECVRCLDEVTVPVSVDLTELFAYPERARAGAAAGDDEAEDVESLLDEDLADLEPPLRDSVVTALPFQPLCSPDCPGLCSECGARLADDPGHHHDVVDPRWSALQSMLGSTSVSDETKES
ncbi:YceD family protein [Antribacter sp. KLBMP9083]|uniref:YceD family protein n=1 Tax=Antribacter soli TaxID=2910976 RepID=A0AA41QEH2_9MICO|nr:YceD family protein [Antribacter soli]MCF4121658.1 YceD family protein [Antribacter soli]